MNIFEKTTWKMGWGNIKRNKRRSIATGVAITAGFIGLNLLGGYLLRVERLLRAYSVYLNHSGHVAIYKKDGLYNFSAQPLKYVLHPDDIQKLQPLLAKYSSQIDFTGGYLSGNALISNGTKSIPAIITGIDLQAEQKILANEFVNKWGIDFKNASKTSVIIDKSKMDPGAVSVTPMLQELLGSRLNDEVQLAGMNFYGDLNAVNATIVTNHTTGSTFFESTGLLAPVTLAQSLFGIPGYSYFSIFLKEGTSARGFFKKLQSELSPDFEAHFFANSETGEIYVGTMGFLYVMAGFFFFLICSAVAISIINSLTISVLERTREIGILRAMGFSPKTVSSLFAKEAFILTLICCVLGAVLSQIVAGSVNNLKIPFRPPGASSDIPFTVTPELWVSLILTIIFFAITVWTSYLVANNKTKAKVINLFSEV